MCHVCLKNNQAVLDTVHVTLFDQSYPFIGWSNGGHICGGLSRNARLLWPIFPFVKRIMRLFLTELQHQYLGQLLFKFEFQASIFCIKTNRRKSFLVKDLCSSHVFPIAYYFWILQQTENYFVYFYLTEIWFDSWTLRKVRRALAGHVVLLV